MPSASLLFRQRLEPEPSAVLAALRDLQADKMKGEASRTAVEEQFFRIACVLLREFPRGEQAASRILAVRASTREELMRRLFRGRDFLLSRMDESVSIADAAEAMRLASNKLPLRTKFVTRQVNAH